MERIVTAREAKSGDLQAMASGIPSLELMQTAAQGVAAAVRAASRARRSGRLPVFIFGRLPGSCGSARSS